MSHADLQQVLDLIDKLSDDERDLVRQRLLERSEVEWREEVEQARREAEYRGIDQTVIDEAVHKRRYGQ